MQHSNRFYSISPKLQKGFQVKLVFFSIGAILIVGLVLSLINISLLLFITLFIFLILTVIAPFYDVPALVKKGKLKYFSLFLLGGRVTNDKLIIHGATLFDCYFTLSDFQDISHMKLIQLEYLKGLISLSDLEDDNQIIEGTTYILNDRRALNFGFKKVKTNPFQKILIVLNYFNQMVTLSFIQKRLCFPRFSMIKTYRTTVGEIKKKAPYFIDLIEKLG